MGRLVPLRAAARIAARDARRARGRTALVATMIGLPLLVATSAGVLVSSIDPTPEQLVEVYLGESAQAEVRAQWAGQVDQGPLGQYGGLSGWEDAKRTTEEQARAVAAVLPDDAELVAATSTGGEATSEARSRPEYATVLELPADRIADLAPAPVTSGKVPRSPGELLVDERTAESLSVTVGDTLTIDLGAPEPTVGTVTGIMEPAPGHVPILAAAGTVPALEVDEGAAWREERWYVFGDSPVTAEHVAQLNALGSPVLSRHVALNPDTWDGMPDAGGIDDGVVAVIAAVAAIGLIEAVLLIGPAFAVGAQRSQRQLAMVAAIGGDSRTLRRIVLLGGVATGLAASVLAVVLGLAVAALAVWGINLARPMTFPGVQVPWLVLPAVVVLGTVMATAAAWLPARTAGKLDVVAALAGRRSGARTRRRGAVAGAVVAAAGVAVALAGAGSSQPFLVVAGVVALEIGIVATAGAIIVLVSRLAPRLGLAGRFALRDAARQRSRTAPAVAAIVAALAGATAGAAYLASSDEQRAATYLAQGPVGTVTAGIHPYESDAAPSPEQLAELSRVLRTMLPVEQVHVAAMASVLDPDNLPTGRWAELVPQWPGGGVCPLDAIARPDEDDLVEHADDPRCRRSSWSQNASLEGRAGGLLVDDGTIVTALGFPGAKDAAAALRAGRVVVGSDLLLGPDGTVRLDHEQWAEAEEVEVVASYELPATAVDLGTTSPQFTFATILPPQVAEELGLHVEDVGLLAATTSLPSPAEEAAAFDAVFDLDDHAYLGVERGPGGEPLAVWVVVGAALVIGLAASLMSIALAQAETRPDLATLAAVGAAPRIRRRIAAAQAGVLTLIGGVLGTGTGLLLALVVVRAMRYQWGEIDPHWQLVVPWPAVAAIGLGVPLLAMGAAWLLTRSRLPMVRRIVA